MAQLEYQYRINVYESQGFQTELYVPEVHPSTKIGFCEWEDDWRYVWYVLNIYLNM